GPRTRPPDQILALNLLSATVLERFLAEFAQRSDFGQLVGAFTGARMVVTVQDEKARPLGDAEVTFTDAKGTVRTLRSRSDGKVVHVSPHDGDAPVKVSVRHGSAAVERAFKDPVPESLIFLPGASAALPSSLDLLLVIDATGSMSDEIEYLKVELRSIAQSIAEAHPQVDQRYGLVVYRDRGDDYLTRRFDFTSSLEDFIKTLGEQSAGGGGDYPEAMEAALADAEGLSWRKGNVARVSFLIADAPPHIEHYGATLGSVERLREKGVVIYPIAASGAASEAEIFMRIAAMLTGAVYIFLTDDSGVGNSHAEPHIPCYFVERLSGVMSRVLQDELAGTRSDPDPSRVIRTVGAPKGGVCTRQ
ncbi:MAG TPA: vWA domain-containing protein, partial [Nannocystaceae bacterium]|nr:vWA domain-containing protein [Nannocystaceae bacterium]